MFKVYRVFIPATTVIYVLCMIYISMYYRFFLFIVAGSFNVHVKCTLFMLRIRTSDNLRVYYYTQHKSNQVINSTPYSLCRLCAINSLFTFLRPDKEFHKS